MNSTGTAKSKADQNLSQVTNNADERLRNTSSTSSASNSAPKLVLPPKKIINKGSNTELPNPAYSQMLEGYAKARGIYKNFSPYQNTINIVPNVYSDSYFQNIIQNATEEELQEWDNIYANYTQELNAGAEKQQLEQAYDNLAISIYKPDQKTSNKQKENAINILHGLGYSESNLGKIGFDNLVNDVSNKQLLVDIINLEASDPNANPRFSIGVKKEDVNKLSGEEIKNVISDWSINRLLYNKHSDNPDLPKILELSLEDKITAYEELPTVREVKAFNDIKAEKIQSLEDELEEELEEGHAAPVAFTQSFLTKTAEGIVGLSNFIVDRFGEGTETDYIKTLDELVNNSKNKIEEASSANINNAILNYKIKYNNGEIDDQTIDDYFEKLAEEFMPEYMAFKGDQELENFTIYDKLKFIATFDELYKQSPYLAAEAMRRDMQEYISGQQEWYERDLYTLQNVGIGTLSQLVQTGLGLWGLGLKTTQGSEAYANFMNSDIVKYWNDVDVYNTFSEDELNKARKYGVSAWNPVVTSEEQYKLFSHHTLNEIQKMGKYIISMTITSGLSSAGLTKLSNLAGVSSSPLVQQGIKLASQGIAVSGMAHSMAYGQFTETLQSANDLIDQRIDRDIESLSRDENVRQQVLTNYFNSPEVLSEMQSYLNQAERYYDEQLRIAKQSDSNATLSISKDDYLKQIKDQYLLEKTKFAEDNIQSLVRNQYGSSLEEEYASDRQTAILAAGKAAETQATLTAIKDGAFGLVFGQWKYAPDARIKIGGKKTNLKWDVNGKATPVKTNLTRWDKVKIVGSKFLGEGLDEWADHHLENFSQGFGLSYFNDLTGDQYNPYAYLRSNNATYNFMTHFDAGVRSVGDGFFDKSGLYEGMIGALSGGFGATPNVGTMMFSNRTDYAKNLGAKDWKSLSGLQKANYFISNGVISDIVDAQNEIRQDGEVAKSINETLEKNKKHLEDIHSVINNHEEELKAIHNSSPIAAENRHVRQGFELAKLINGEVTSQSPIVQKQAQEIQRLAKGEITEEDINKYINQPQNKELRNNPNAKEIAKENLQKNAQQLVRIINNSKHAFEAINNSRYGKELSEATKNQLVFNKIFDNDAHERLNSLEELITGNKKEYNINTTSTADFNSKEGYDTMVSESKKHISELKETIKSSKRQIRKLAKKDRLAAEGLSLILQKAERDLQIEKDALKELKKENFEEGSRRVLSKNEIMQLNPEQRARMLDEDNWFMYSKEQREVIDELYSELMLSNPNAISLIQEAGELYRDKRMNLKAYNNIIKNGKAYEAYVSSMQRSFYNRAARAALEINTKELGAKLNSLKDDEIKSFLLTNKYSKNLVENYRKNYLDKDSQRAKIIEQVEPLLGLYRAAADIAEAKLTIEDQKRFKQLLVNIALNSNTVEEIMTALEQYLDQLEDSDLFKKALEEVLKGLALDNYQRNAKILEERKAKEEAAKKQKEKEQKKLAEQKKPEEKKEEKKDEEEFTETEKIDLDGGSTKTPPTSTEQTFTEEAYMSPTLDQEAQKDGVSQVKNIDASLVDDGNVNTEGTSSEMCGLPWSEFNNNEAAENHYLVDERESLGQSAETASTTDYKKEFFDFIDDPAHKIKLQEIVDFELAKMLEENPDMEVHFMMTPVNSKASGIPFLVIEYTNSVKKYHNEERGKPIIANGKEWLIIGNAYTSNNATFISLLNRLKADRNTKMTASDNYYVSDIFTKIKEIGSGRLVKRKLGETETTLRNVSELLYDENGYNEERNPNHIGNPKNKSRGYSDVKWGIQKLERFVTVNVGDAQTMDPSAPSENQGAVFMLIPAANGKFIPAYINPVFYTTVGDKGGIKDGALKEKIEQLAVKLLTKDFEKRKAVKDELRKFLVFDEANNIEIGTDGGTALTVVKNGKRITDANGYPIKYKLDGSTTAEDIFNILKMLNPRINITVSTLNDGDLMEEYEEAGALTTDIAYLHTRNASFTVFSLDENGKIKDDSSPKVYPTSSTRGRARRIAFNGTQYSFYDNAWHDANDNVISKTNSDGIINTDNTELIQKLEYKKIIENRSYDFQDADGDNYYILDNNPDNPVVITENNKGQITILSKEIALDAINWYKKEQERIEKENASKQEIYTDVKIGISSTSEGFNVLDKSVDMPDLRDEIKDGFITTIERNGRTYIIVPTTGGRLGDNFTLGFDRALSPQAVSKVIEIIKNDKSNNLKTLRTEIKNALENVVTTHLEDIDLGEDAKFNPGSHQEQLFEGSGITPPVTPDAQPESTKSKENTNNQPQKEEKSLEESKELTTFETLFKKTPFKMKLKGIFQSKGWKWSTSAKEMVKVLEEHNVSLIGIDNLEDWLNMIKNCK